MTKGIRVGWVCRIRLIRWRPLAALSVAGVGEQRQDPTAGTLSDEEVAIKERRETRTLKSPRSPRAPVHWEANRGCFQTRRLRSSHPDQHQPSRDPTQSAQRGNGPKNRHVEQHQQIKAAAEQQQTRQHQTGRPPPTRVASHRHSG